MILKKEEDKQTTVAGGNKNLKGKESRTKMGQNSGNLVLVLLSFVRLRRDILSVRTLLKGIEL